MRMMQLSAKAEEALQRFSGRWQLDLKKSDSTLPMLEALKVPYLPRKWIASLEVQQTISISGSDLVMKNDTAYGSTSVVHVVNGGRQVITDDKGEKTLDDTILEDDAEFPVVIRAQLDKGRGFTKDSRKVEGNLMIQMLEFRVTLDSPPIVMRRYWTRIGSEIPSAVVSKEKNVDRSVVTDLSKKTNVLTLEGNGVKLDKQVKKPIVGNGPLVSATNTKNTTTIDQVRNQTLNHGTSLRTKDWTSMVLLAVFFTSAYGRESYWESFFWLALLLLFRFHAIFPPSTPETDWWNLASAKFAATATVMIYSTRSIMSPSRDIVTSALESLFIVLSYAWTRRSDIAKWDLASTFTVDTVITETRAWMENCIIAVACTCACTSSDASTSALIFSVALYLIGRYRIQIKRGVNAQDKLTSFLNNMLTKKAPPALPAAPIKAAHAQPSIRITSTRIAKYSSKAFAQYLAEVCVGQEPYLVWCRYRDLEACHQEISDLYKKEGWTGLPLFPPKIWGDSTLPAVTEERKRYLDDYFSKVVSDHGIKILGLDSVKQVFHTLEFHSSTILREIPTALKCLSKAKEICELAVASSDASVWKRLEQFPSAYLRADSVNTEAKLFKTCFATNKTIPQILDQLLYHRSSWDSDFSAERVLRKFDIDMYDARQVFSGMNVSPGPHGSLCVKIVIRDESSWLYHHQQTIYVVQGVVFNKRSGRYLFLEATPSNLVFKRDDNTVSEEFVYANGYVLDPLQNDTTMVNAIRWERNAKGPFSNTI